MYEKLSKLTDEQINTLRTLQQNVSMTDKHIRLGENGQSNLSVYTYSKWTDWTREQKTNFKTAFTEEQLEKSVIGWFLHFPANTGFLDRMIAWEGQTHCGTVISYAFEDQEIYINDQAVSILAGEGIKFKLNTIHEIRPQTHERNWACIMVMV